MSNESHILLTEDDKPLAELVKTYLQKHHFTVTVAHTAAETRRLLQKHPFALFILDIGLPDSNSFDLCLAIKNYSSSPIIIVTARSSDSDHIHGLELGADDYLIKPIDPKLLLARINALLRRSSTSDKPGAVLHFGTLVIDSHRKEVFLDNLPLDLTTKEFNLLWVLASHAGEILNRDYLLKALRGIEFDGLDRSIDIKISKLRRKLGDDIQQPKIIKTIWGQGYLFINPQ